MRLSDYTDYTLRVLMYCAGHPDRLVTIAEIAEAHGVSKNHLMKIVNDLGRDGVLETVRGRGGGLRLLRPAGEITVGEVVRRTETDFRIVECFDAATDTCALSAGCRLKAALGGALQAWFAELDRVTLADLAGGGQVGGGAGRPVRMVRGGAAAGVRAGTPAALAERGQRAAGTPQ